MKAVKRFLLVLIIGIVSFILVYNIAIKVHPPLAYIDGKTYPVVPTGQFAISIFASLLTILVSLYFIVGKSK